MTIVEVVLMILGILVVILAIFVLVRIHNISIQLQWHQKCIDSLFTGVSRISDRRIEDKMSLQRQIDIIQDAFVRDLLNPWLKK